MPGKQLNPQHPAPQQQHKPHPKPHQHRPDEEEDGRVSYRIDQGKLMIKASTRELSFPIKQELKAVTVLYSRVINNNKSQAFNPSISQAGYSQDGC